MTPNEKLDALTSYMNIRIQFMTHCREYNGQAGSTSIYDFMAFSEFLNTQWENIKNDNWRYYDYISVDKNGNFYENLSSGKAALNSALAHRRVFSRFGITVFVDDLEGLWNINPNCEQNGMGKFIKHNRF